MSAYYSQQNKTETPNCFVDPMKGIDPCRLSASDMFIVAARGRMLTGKDARADPEGPGGVIQPGGFFSPAAPGFSCLRCRTNRGWD